jgi:beta-galactosidase
MTSLRMRRSAMPTNLAIVIFCLVFPVAAPAAGPEDFAVSLPSGVQAVWDIKQAEREATSTRERICLNGLRRWQPADAGAGKPPAGRWGYFKVPGCWPGISDYMQKDSQTVFAHPNWKDSSLAGISAAWYEREFTVPDDWEHRRLTLQVEYLNSYVAVYVDGSLTGEIRFPGGELDLTKACGSHPQGKHTLSLLVVALPLKAVLISYNDSAAARAVQGTVARRGLCGDVYLSGEPAAARIADVKIETSVRNWQLTLDAALAGLDPGRQYRLRARIEGGAAERKEFTGPAFTAADLKAGRIAQSHAWRPGRLWDIHTPQNAYRLSLALLDSDDRELDVAGEVRFGFREFWIDGRDFYLNGSRLYLSAVPLDNAQVSAGLATYEAACESLRRLQTFGINFVYTHNYGCEPGSHLSFTEVLRAADDLGMLVSFSQPHFSHYEWQAAEADRENGYARHAEYYVRAAQNHPAVVCYSMSHNGTGYDEDMNPDMIDGRQDARDQWAVDNVKLALRAEAIVRRFDPSRIVYHHASGNLGSMHSSNFYPNFAPI